jgi:hypothetical protein
VSDPFIRGSDLSGLGEHSVPAATTHAPIPDEERPPSCPSCNRRLVILATHWNRDDDGRSVRRQLWGCPRGHATAYRNGGTFSAIELMPSVIG